ncbi:GNAT family N-acetyltransferase [Microlunatus parietis]|uniref:RimJ/RimL family protein N-acetyltransferase n=1 Tax=Microlunatus parietis TaxID=682979 RepID=A0A7Y9IAX7_9ACTN|nr:GNAT family N-acetyltransferase [Microlunatus parietis]NYE73571.1 RimJ/RimL family protein N-acetyltransferase [Microlunatus parietis]
MRIRRAAETDLGELQRAIFTDMSLAELRAADERFNRPPDSLHIVAENDDGEIVASCNLIRETHRMRRHRAELGGFVIVPAERGSGLARRMIDYLARYARREWDVSILDVACRGGTAAERAYRGLGFTEWARLPGGYLDYDAIYDEVRLYRPVPPLD